MADNSIYSEQSQQELLEKRIERNRERVTNVLDTIQNDGELLNDFILNLGKSSPINFKANGNVKLNIDNGEHHEYDLHPHAIIQTGEKLGINSTYIKDLAGSSLDWKKQLIAHDLNTFVANTERNRVLVRAVGGEIRGVLTDAYKRIDTNLLYKTFIDKTQELGMQVIDIHYDNLQSYLESVYPRVFRVGTPRNGENYFAFGIRMRAGNFGTSANELSFYMERTVCWNGMTSTNVIREVHIGRRLPDDIKYAEDTMIADSKASSLQFRDAINTVMNRGAIENKILLLQEASDTVVDINGKLKEISRSNKMNKSEVEKLKTIITGNRYEDGVQGENTLFKLSQAVSRVGVLTEDKTRKRELDELAYSLLTKKS